MKYQKIAIWRAFLPKTLNSFHPHSAYPPTCTRRAHFTFPCPCPSQGRTNTLLPTRPPRAEKTQNPAVPTRDREGGGGGGGGCSKQQHRAGHGCSAASCRHLKDTPESVVTGAHRAGRLTRRAMPTRGGRAWPA
jgi:hypothetical protein